MAISVDRLSNPAVRALVHAINDNDEQAFYQVLTPDATMSDDGSDRDLRQWAEREIFSSHGHLEVDREREGGLGLIANYRNDTWGEMRTAWHFEVEGDRISRFETGQA
jgi:hypothetical protein